MKVKVTAEDINDGKRGDRCGCPIALALIRCLGKTVEVGYYRCYVRGGGSYRLPGEAKLFITLFDFGYPVEPFEFEI